MERDNIALEGFSDTYYVIDEQEFNGDMYYLVESEEWGDEEPCVIVSENLEIEMVDVWNGFDDFEYYINS